MFRGDATNELARLERGLRDAEERFVHAPGGLWLAASGTLEALSRIDPVLLDGALKERAARLTEEARRMQHGGDTRASQHELAALAEWVELARHRAAHERVFLAAMAEAPRRFSSRRELAELVEADDRALETLARAQGGALSPAAESLVASLRAQYPDYDPYTLPEELVIARGREAQRALSGGGAARRDATWRVAPFPSSALLLVASSAVLCAAAAAFFYFGALARLAAIATVGVGLLASASLLLAAVLRRRREITRRVLALEVWGYRARSAKALESARAKHEKWVTIARTLGQLDAFKRSEPGAALEARELRLPALAPWVRTLVGGLDEDVARRFDGTE